MKYRVWDTDIGKLFGVFDSEGEALTLVRALADSYGEDIGDISMTCERPDGTFGKQLSGAALVRYAEQAAADREPAEAHHGEVIGSRRGGGGGGYNPPMPMAARGMDCGSRHVHHSVVAPGRGSRRSTSER